MASSSLILRSLWLQWLLVQVFPRLRAWPVEEWSQLLARTMEGEFDQIERFGIIAGVVLATWLLRPEASDISAPFAFLVQLACALPLLLVFAGPFYLRRVRRGLDQAAREQGKSDDKSFGEGD